MLLTVFVLLSTFLFYEYLEIQFREIGNEMTISSEFLEPGTDYLWEVLAIEEGGNQSLNSSQFSTSS
jgi:hypothetical protein